MSSKLFKPFHHSIGATVSPKTHFPSKFAFARRNLRSQTHISKFSTSLYRPKYLQDASKGSISTLEKASEVAYSRTLLVRKWHEASRDLNSPFDDLKWAKKEFIGARCIIIKDDGIIEEPTAPIRKEDLLHSYGLQARDLRTLDSHILDVRPTLIVASKSILYCSPILRAVISHDRILLIGSDPSNGNSLTSEEETLELVRSIQNALDYVGKSNGKIAPFEFRALESLLLITVRGFRHVAEELQERVHSILPALRFGVSPVELRDLLECKRTVEDCVYSGRSLQSAITALLSEDEDLAGMYLTDKFNQVPRTIDDHQTAELLLEYYERRLDETNESALRLASLLSDIDANITLVLASTRVRLQNLELQTAIVTLSLAAGATIASFFGMNLTSGFETSESGFSIVTMGGVGVMIGIMAIGWIRLLRARRSQLFLGNSRSDSTRGLEARRNFESRRGIRGENVKKENEGKKDGSEI